jgi:hypothetical protein
VPAETFWMALNRKIIHFGSGKYQTFEWNNLDLQKYNSKKISGIVHVSVGNIHVSRSTEIYSQRKYMYLLGIVHVSVGNVSFLIFFLLKSQDFVEKNSSKVFIFFETIGVVSN